MIHQQTNRTKLRTANEAAAVLYPKAAEHFTAFVEYKAGIGDSPLLQLLDLSDDFWAQTVGFVCNEDDPFVFVPQENTFRRYNPARGIYEPVRDAAVVSCLMANLDRCAGQFPSRVNVQSFLALKNRQRIKAVVERAREVLAVDDEFFRTQPHRLAVQNGILDLTTGKLNQFNPALPMKETLPVRFDPDAKCELFLNAFLRQVLQPIDVDLLQLYLGQLLEGNNYSQTILLLTGESGWGKSSLIKILGGMLGWNNIGIIRDQLFKSDHELLHYQGKRLLLHPDMPTDFLNRPEASLFKQLVGGDPLWAEGKDGEMVTIEGNFPVVLSCNGKPRIKIDSDQNAWMRRLLVVPFQAAEHDKHWGKMVDLIVKTEASGILNWLLDGRRKLAKAQFQINRTQEQQRRTTALVMASESPKAFIRECLQRQEGEEMEVADLYAHYQKWCVENQLTPFAGRFFSQIAKDEIEMTLGLRFRHDLKSKDGTAIRGWRHLGFVKPTTENVETRSESSESVSNVARLALNPVEVASSLAA